MSSGN